jgi:hypothetical protein
MLRMIPNPSSPVFTLVESVPLGEVSMNTLFLPTSNQSSSNDTSVAALQIENGDLPVILSSSVGLPLIRVMDVVYSGASRVKYSNSMRGCDLID